MPPRSAPESAEGRAADFHLTKNPIAWQSQEVTAVGFLESDVGPRSPLPSIQKKTDYDMEKKDSFQVTMEKEQICEPGPLGLAAFAFTVFVLSAHNAGWAPDVMWVGPALFYGGLVLLLAGMWEFKKNNVFGATGFSTFGGFWMGLGFFVVLRLAGLVPEGVDVSEAFGWFLTGLLIFNSYMTLTASLLPKAIFLAFVLTEATLILLIIGSFRKDNNYVKLGGYVGIATSASAWYASFAVLFNITAKKMVFPLGCPFLSFASTNPAGVEGEP